VQLKINLAGGYTWSARISEKKLLFERRSFVQSRSSRSKEATASMVGMKQGRLRYTYGPYLLLLSSLRQAPGLQSIARTGQSGLHGHAHSLNKVRNFGVTSRLVAPQDEELSR
jgi:hypothetical protein